MPQDGAADDQTGGDARPRSLLADDLLRPRDGARARSAAQYVAAQFQAMGLEPAGVNGTFFQPIRLRAMTIVPAETSVTILRAGQEEKLVWGQDYYAAGDPRETISSLNGRLMFVAHGITAPDFGIDDYSGADVRGKIVALLAGAPSRLSSTERAHFGNARTKLDNAAAQARLAPSSSGTRTTRGWHLFLEA
jgi:hypothetical protein